MFLGPSIKNDLMNLLQSRLDDAVLESLYVQLQRNPASKLALDDIKVGYHNMFPAD